MADVDSHELDAFLNALSDDNLKNKILYDAVKAGAEVLKKDTISNLTQSMSRSSNLIRGVRIGTREKAYLTANVNIMGVPHLKWFEKGTAERVTKSGHRTGSIKPLYFFRQARQNESAITEAIMRSIDTAMRNLITQQ